MTTYRILIGLAGAVLAAGLWGCGGAKAAREVALLRKQGQPDQARAKALELLNEDADRMAVWRELAYTDEALFRVEKSDANQRLGYLVEAALLGAAVCGRHGGTPPDDHWQAVCNLLRADAKSRMVAIMSGVKVRVKEERRKLIVTGDEDLIDRMEHDGITFPDTYMDSWREADPLEAETAVRKYSILQALLTRLPAPSEGPEGKKYDPLSELNEWARGRNLDTDYLNAVYQQAEQDVAAAYARAIEELQESGYPQAATITENGLLP